MATTAAVTDSITAVLPAVAGGEVKCQGGKARGFDCKDASLVAFMPNGSIGAKRGTLLNGIWGWTDSTTGREFALVGRTDGTSFVEVTDPANPKYLGDLPLHQGARPNIWREIKVYRTTHSSWPTARAAWHADLRPDPASLGVVAPDFPRRPTTQGSTARTTS